MGEGSEVSYFGMEIAERDFPMNVASILTIRECQRAAKVAGKVLHVEHAETWLPVLAISHAGVCVLVSTPLGAIVVRPGIGKSFNLL